MTEITANELLEKLGSQPSYGAAELASFQVTESCSLMGEVAGAGIIEAQCSGLDSGQKAHTQTTTFDNNKGFTI